MQKFVFTDKDLNDVLGADKALKTFLLAIDDEDSIEFDMMGVESISSEFADRFFGVAGIECLKRKVSMYFLFTPDKGRPIVNAIEAAVRNAIPPTFGLSNFKVH